MPKGFRFVLISGMIFFLCVLGLVGGVLYVFQNRVYPGVSIAGESLSGKTHTEAENIINKKVASYASHPFKVVVPDPSHPLADSPNKFIDQEISSTAGNLGMTFNGKKSLEAAWTIGHTKNPYSWITSVLPAFFGGTNYSISYEVHPEVVKSFVFSEVIPKLGAPIPAQIQVHDTVVSVSSPRQGFVVNEAKLQSDLALSLSESTEADTTYIRAPVSQVNSPITEGSVRPLADSLDAIGNISIKLVGSDTVLKPNRAEVLTWFAPVQDQSGVIQLAVQKSSIDHYLNQKAPNGVDTKQSADAVVQAITPILVNKPSVNTIEVAMVSKPVTTRVAEPGNYTVGKFEGKYLEVNLAEQKMYRINGANLEKTYLVSSGKASTPTPTGTYHIHGKSPRAFSYMYGLYMPWWENFLGGAYGIHELPVWPNGYREGEGHLGIPVSDGCVRLGIGDAKELYDWTEDGTTVYIH